MMVLIKGILPAVFIQLLGFLCYQTKPTDGAKILLYPVDIGFNSRAMNMAKLATYLQDDGHQVSIILNQPILDKYNPKHLNIIKYDLPKDIKLVTDPEVLANLAAIMNSYFSIFRLYSYYGVLAAPFCEALVQDEVLMKELKREKYDLFILDYINDCGRILSDYLDIAMIYYSNHGFPTYDIVYPRLTSFTCDSLNTVCSGDVMTFKERMLNLVFTMLYDSFLNPLMLSHFQDLRDKYDMNTTISIHKPVRMRKSMIIVNVDFVLDYPRPLMPNVIPISGLYLRDPNPLPTDLASIMDNPEYNDIVVVSFGTLVDKVPPERAEIMARIFGKLKALVIWRFTGVPPKAVSKNTKLVGWFPQFDVLAHPKTKLFITHCGASGTFETASLGIPVLAVPMLGDQRYHALQLVNRLRMGVLTDWIDFTETKFEEDLLKVFKNEEFSRNAKTAASLMNDRDIEPKQKFLHLVNYTIRHNGAEHLISGPGVELTSLQFYSVDVACFILMTLVIFVLAVIFTCQAICHLKRKVKAKKSKVA